MNPFSPQVAATQGEEQQEQSKSLGAGPTGALVPQIGVSGTSSPIEVSDVEEAPEGGVSKMMRMKMSYFHQEKNPPLLVQSKPQSRNQKMNERNGKHLQHL